MATVNTEKALAEYQRRIGNMMNEIIMRDVAIAELEEENQRLRGQLIEAQPAPPAAAG